MTRNDVQAVLRRFGEAHELGSLQLDNDGCVVIDHPSGVTVLCTVMPQPVNSLVLYSELGEPADRDRAFRIALEAGHLWSGGDGLSLGVMPGTDELTASMQIRLDDAFAEAFEGAFEHFTERALYWAARFHEARSDDAATELPDETASAGGELPGRPGSFLRV